MSKKRGRAAVVVLGDIGRSPRMQYHALSLARQASLEVDIVAYGAFIRPNWQKTYNHQQPRESERQYSRKQQHKYLDCTLFQPQDGYQFNLEVVALHMKSLLRFEYEYFQGSDPHAAILEHPSIHIHRMAQWPKFTQNLPWVFRPIMLLVKPVFQFIVLLWYLCVKIPAPDLFLVQNPPSVPTLVAVKWASWLRRSVFILDWHNFGYTLLGLSLGRGSRFVAVYRWFEKHYGQQADGSLCVTKAMQHELAQNWGIRATVLYDQPPDFFHPSSLEEKHRLFLKLDKELRYCEGISDCISHGSKDMRIDELLGTLFTTTTGTGTTEKSTRPALIVSSTSWTPDEDFGILLEAAVMYDRRVAAILNEDDSVKEEVFWDRMNDGSQYQYPSLVFIITGKGPEKEKYEQKIKKLHLKRVAFRTMWLSAEDYPVLLGSADLGVCLHTSSSGLDLPMKVVDMFGCGLPVCAVSYSCIEELVKVEQNGLLFSSSSELADQLLALFKGFPYECDVLRSLRNGALETRSSAAWATEWEQNAKPLLLKVMC